MAARDCEISTESEDAEDFAEDRWQDASKRCIPEVIGTMNLKRARCPSAEGVLNGGRLRREIIMYLRTATYEIAVSMMRSN